VVSDDIPGWAKEDIDADLKRERTIDGRSRLVAKVGMMAHPGDHSEWLCMGQAKREQWYDRAEEIVAFVQKYLEETRG
jgi:hypothetical protein